MKVKNLDMKPINKVKKMALKAHRERKIDLFQVLLLNLESRMPETEYIDFCEKNNIFY